MKRLAGYKFRQTAAVLCIAFSVAGCVPSGVFQLKKKHLAVTAQRPYTPPTIEGILQDALTFQLGDPVDNVLRAYPKLNLRMEKAHWVRKLKSIKYEFDITAHLFFEDLAYDYALVPNPGTDAPVPETIEKVYIKDGRVAAIFFLPTSDPFNHLKMKGAWPPTKECPVCHLWPLINPTTLKNQFSFTASAKNSSSQHALNSGISVSALRYSNAPIAVALYTPFTASQTEQLKEKYSHLQNDQSKSPGYEENPRLATMHFHIRQYRREHPDVEEVVPDSLWEQIVSAKLCMPSGNLWTPREYGWDQMKETNYWQLYRLAGVPKNILVPFLIGKLASKRETGIHICPFDAAQEGELAAYFLQHATHHYLWNYHRKDSVIKSVVGWAKTADDDAGNDAFYSTQEAIRHILENSESRQALADYCMDEYDGLFFGAPIVEEARMQQLINLMAWHSNDIPEHVHRELEMNDPQQPISADTIAWQKESSQHSTLIARVKERLRSLGFSAMPVLVRNLQNNQVAEFNYQCSVSSMPRNPYFFRNICAHSVGEMCAELLSELIAPAPRGSDMKRAPDYVLDHVSKKPKIWLANHQNLTLAEIQIEVLEWRINEETKQRTTWENLSDADWRQSVIVPLEEALTQRKAELTAEKSDAPNNI